MLVIATVATAKPRRAAEMRQIAQQVLSKTSAEAATMVLLDEAQGYAVYGHEQGFAIISKNDSQTPVLGYSSTPYNKDDMPCAFRYWLNAVSTSLEAGTTDPLNQKYDEVAPLLTTTWGQGDPFNSMCPKVNGALAPTGCVATAMAQILYFYRYPVQGKGQGYYTMGANSYRQLVDINSTYRWDLMKDSYTNSFFITEEEKNAIGQLMADAGAAAHMNYSAGGSGSTGYVAANAFAQVFQFDSLTMRCVDREYCQDDAEWMMTIQNELKAGRPILMCGQDPAQGGHAFVIDGINSNGYVHVNWGWNGTADGFYDIKDMAPQGTTQHFNYDQSIVTNLRCDPEPLEGTTYKSCWHISVEDNLTVGELNDLVLSAPDGILWQNYHLTFYGKIGLAFLDGDGQEAFFHTFFDTGDKASGMAPIEGGYGFMASYFSHVSTIELAALPVGTYRVFLASKAIQDSAPQPICYPSGSHKEYLVTKAADNSLSVTVAETSGIDAASIGTKHGSSSLYDLQGRQVVSPDRKGIYIRDGRKVVVR